VARLVIVLTILLVSTSFVERAPNLPELQKPVVVDIPIQTVQIATVKYEDPAIEVLQEPEYEIYEITAYTAGYESTGKTPDHPEYGITASGVKAKENHTIACPKSMEFGTKVYIPYFDHTFVCEDRGGAITEGKLDVYMPGLQDALEFGRRELEVLVLDKP
jgi:3D (Asp-Asp-Asp) domain-containing protein